LAFVAQFVITEIGDAHDKALLQWGAQDLYELLVGHRRRSRVCAAVFLLNGIQDRLDALPYPDALIVRVQENR
jgi:hypothetical protein